MLNNPGLFSPVFNGRGPGRVLAVLGILISLGGFAGLAFIAFDFVRALGMAGGGPAMPHDLPSGVPLAVVYAGGFVGGGFVGALGDAMATAGAGRSPGVGHWLIFFLVLAVLGVCVIQVLGGASPAVLNPIRFGHGSPAGSGRQGRGTGAGGDSASHRADDVVTIRYDSAYGMKFEPSLLSISAGQRILFTNRSPFTCPFEAVDGELPLVHGHSPVVGPGRSLSVTWPDMGAAAFECRSDRSLLMQLSVLP
jgi:plastocyanin